MGFLGDILFVMRVGSNPDVFSQVENTLANIAFTHPTAGDSGRGQAFGQTGPSTLAEQRRIALDAERNDTTLPFAGL